jgi:hypothetical protein
VRHVNPIFKPDTSRGNAENIAEGMDGGWEGTIGSTKDNCRDDLANWLYAAIPLPAARNFKINEP